jgi:hypothetical protein
LLGVVQVVDWLEAVVEQGVIALLLEQAVVVRLRNLNLD